MKQVKGQFGRRKNVWTVAKNAYEKGMGYAYRDRRTKMSYSEFMGKLHAKDINLSRKVLADLAMNNPEAFKAIVDAVK